MNIVDLLIGRKMAGGAKPGQSKTVTPTAAGFTVSPDTGYALAKVVVEGDSDLVPANIKKGVEVFGVTGELEEGSAGESDLSLTSASYLFYYGHRNQSLNGLLAACGKVTSCSSMFESCESKFKSLDLSILDTSACTNMGSMFKKCSGLESLTLGGAFDTSQVANMNYMFGGCNNLTELDVSNFDTSNVIDMYCMFFDCNKLTELDVSNFDTAKVTNMQTMFSGCNSLNSLDVSNFDTANVTNMRQMFTECENLTELDVSNFDTAKVTDMGYMFKDCSKLTKVDVSSKELTRVDGTTYTSWNTSKVTDMGYMFFGCDELTELDVTHFDTAKVTNMSGMFTSCEALQEIVGFSATNRAGMSVTFPLGTASSPMALKRLTFRTDLGEGAYSIRSAINIKYCSFDRDGMVEMFNSLPDISALGLAGSYKTITITGNPCVTDGSLSDDDKLIATNKGWVLTI